MAKAYSSWSASVQVVFGNNADGSFKDVTNPADLTDLSRFRIRHPSKVRTVLVGLSFGPIRYLSGFEHCLPPGHQKLFLNAAVVLYALRITLPVAVRHLANFF